jgi:HPt (histidine-containing phosphotransfer) domain-containing protein
VALFESLLVRVLRDYADFKLPVSVSPDDLSNRNQLKGRSHKLKGSAGVIGATKVMQLAGAVEVALEEGRPVEIVDELLSQLASALTVLSDETELLLAHRSERTAADAGPKTATRFHITKTDIDELRSLLESQNLAALDKFAMLSPSLSELVGAVRFDRLREAINNLDFELGADLLRDAPKPKGSAAVSA